MDAAVIHFPKPEMTPQVTNNSFMIAYLQKIKKTKQNAQQ